jgi:hypothetical protein
MVRNIWCRDYNDCLIRTVQAKKEDFTCIGCLHESDKSGQDEINIQEVIACGKLIHQIFAEPYVEALNA